MDILGNIKARQDRHYLYPIPVNIEQFIRVAISRMKNGVSQDVIDRVAGIGIALPFELWNWPDELGVSRSNTEPWRDYSIGNRCSRITGQPVYVANDVNMACLAELTFGSGSTFKDFAYFYVGHFVGGAAVLGGKVFHGSRGNAGAFSSIPVGSGHQLINLASINSFARRLNKQLGHPVNLASEEAYWHEYEDIFIDWLDEAANGIVQAAVAVAAVLDHSDFVVDGIFPPSIRSRLTTHLNATTSRTDQRGIHRIRFHKASWGLKPVNWELPINPFLPRCSSRVAS